MGFGKGGVDDAEDAEVILHEYGHQIHFASPPVLHRARPAPSARASATTGRRPSARSRAPAAAARSRMHRRVGLRLVHRPPRSLPPPARREPDLPGRPRRRGPPRRTIWSQALWQIRGARQREGRHRHPDGPVRLRRRHDAGPGGGHRRGGQALRRGRRAQVERPSWRAASCRSARRGDPARARLPAGCRVGRLRLTGRIAATPASGRINDSSCVRRKRRRGAVLELRPVPSATDLGGGRMASSRSATPHPTSRPRRPKGAITLPRLDRRLVGGAVLAPEGLHAGLHDRARLHGEDQAGVRQAQREDHRALRRPDGRPRGVGEGHRGDAGHRAQLPDDRRRRLRRLEALRDARRRRLRRSRATAPPPTTRPCATSS